MSSTSLPAGWNQAATGYLKVWITSTVISAMAYGGMVSLTLSYIPLLLKTSNDISRRTLKFLLLYAAFMLTISTTYMITMAVTLTKNMFLPFDLKVDTSLNLDTYFVQNGVWGGVCVILASWGADGFMVRHLQIAGEEAIDSGFHCFFLC